jgi:hypothetical protein
LLSHGLDRAADVLEQALQFVDESGVAIRESRQIHAHQPSRAVHLKQHYDWIVCGLGLSDRQHARLSSVQSFRKTRKAFMQNMQTSSELSISEVRILSLASIGGALEFYDFVIFVFLANVIGKLFFAASLPEWVRQAQTFGIFAAGYLARPLGGIVMAHFGDTRGRKRMFTLSVLLMAIPTLLIGLLPTYQSIGLVAPLLLLSMRVLQGVAIGGEAPGAWVFVAEHARRGRVGFAVGLLTGGLSN